MTGWLMSDLLPIEPLPPLFDFSSYAGNTGGFLQTLKEFAAGTAFRSAAVEELVLQDDFCRRPLRPEDFEFLKFMKPVQASTVSRLPSLASQRTLLSLYELSSAVPPFDADSSRFAAFAEFASERNRLYAAQLTPFLEAYAFEYLSKTSPASESTSASAARLGRIYADEYQFWMRVFGELTAADYFDEGLRFILIQRWCLAPSRHKVMAETHARGHFDAWPAGSAPDFVAVISSDIVGRMAAMLGVTGRQHSYWQFYLPTSLSKCNLLYALARRSEQSFALYGALYAAQAEHLAFEAALAQCCPHLAAGLRVDIEPRDPVDRLLRQFESGLEFVLRRHPNSAPAQMGQGLAVAAKLAERGRWDLGEQLNWLSAIDRYCEHARTLSNRIEAECPGIDRETFVEPRDMCSTTHVHNDHRLVTIQEGVMHFWGNLGMRLEMHPGDMVLIPEGRLHGSTVLSPECTYHQPIIPEDWMQQLNTAPMPSAPARASGRTVAPRLPAVGLAE